MPLSFLIVSLLSNLCFAVSAMEIPNAPDFNDNSGFSGKTTVVNSPINASLSLIYYPDDHLVKSGTDALYFSRPVIELNNATEPFAFAFDKTLRFISSKADSFASVVDGLSLEFNGNHLEILQKYNDALNHSMFHIFEGKLDVNVKSGWFEFDTTSGGTTEKYGLIFQEESSSSSTFNSEFSLVFKFINDSDAWSNTTAAFLLFGGSNTVKAKDVFILSENGKNFVNAAYLNHSSQTIHSESLLISGPLNGFVFGTDASLTIETNQLTADLRKVNGDQPSGYFIYAGHSHKNSNNEIQVTVLNDAFVNGSLSLEEDSRATFSIGQNFTFTGNIYSGYLSPIDINVGKSAHFTGNIHARYLGSIDIDAGNTVNFTGKMLSDNGSIVLSALKVLKTDGDIQLNYGGNVTLVGGDNSSVFAPSVYIANDAHFLYGTSEFNVSLGKESQLQIRMLGNEAQARFSVEQNSRVSVKKLFNFPKAELIGKMGDDSVFTSEFLILNEGGLIDISAGQRSQFNAQFVVNQPGVWEEEPEIYAVRSAVAPSVVQSSSASTASPGTEDDHIVIGRLTVALEDGSEFNIGTASNIGSVMNLSAGANSALNATLIKNSEDGTLSVRLGDNAVMTVGSVINEAGYMPITLGKSAVLKAHVQDAFEGEGIHLSLDSGSTWTAKGRSSLTRLNAKDSIIILEELGTSGNPTLTVGELNASGTIFRLANTENAASFIQIGEDVGDQSEHKVQIQHPEIVTKGIDIHFATDDSGKLTFKAHPTITDQGLFVMTPEMKAKAAASGKNWYISSIIEEPGPTPISMIEGLENNYLFWRLQTESTKERFGDLRDGYENGVWARATFGTLHKNDFRNQYQSYRFGADAKVGEHLSLGGMLELHHGSLKSDNGSGDMDAVSGAIYGLYVLSSGCYADVGMRLGTMRHKYTNGSMLVDKYRYRGTAFGVWAEGGKEWTIRENFFVTPRVQVQYGHFGTEDFTTRNGLKAHVGSVNSTILTAGTDFGVKTDRLRVTAALEVNTEVAGKQTVRVSHGAQSLSHRADYSDTWMETGLSAFYRPTKNTQVWLNTRKSIGADVKNDWRANFGVRYQF